MDGYYGITPGIVSVPDADLFVVVPTIRPELLTEFCERWVDPDLNVKFIFVHDRPRLLWDGPLPESPLITHLCWADIDAELGNRRWIIPRRSDCVRSYGFLRAAQMGARYILSLDDDCDPQYDRREFFEAHLRPLILGLRPSFSTTGYHDAGNRPRGLPDAAQDRIIDRKIPVAINHGLWDGVLDRSGRDEQDVIDRLGGKQPKNEYLDEGLCVVPHRMFYPMCGMNVCFHVRMLSAMYFTLQGHWYHPDTGELTKLPYDRWGDIWCGAISKAVCDVLGCAVTSGDPHVYHSRRSNTLANIEKEAAGLDLHPHIVRAMLDLVDDGRPQMWHLMRQVSESLDDLAFDIMSQNEAQAAYLAVLSQAIREWRLLTIAPEDQH